MAEDPVKQLSKRYTQQIYEIPVPVKGKAVLYFTFFKMTTLFDWECAHHSVWHCEWEVTEHTSVTTKRKLFTCLQKGKVSVVCYVIYTLRVVFAQIMTTLCDKYC